MLPSGVVDGQHLRGVVCRPTEEDLTVSQPVRENFGHGGQKVLMTVAVRTEHGSTVDAVQLGQPANVLRPGRPGDQARTGNDAHVLTRTNVEDLDARVRHKGSLVDCPCRVVHPATGGRTELSDPGNPRLSQALMNGD